MMNIETVETMSIAEAAAYANVSERTIRRWVDERLVSAVIPPSRWGKRVVKASLVEALAIQPAIDR